MTITLEIEIPKDKDNWSEREGREENTLLPKPSGKYLRFIYFKAQYIMINISFW